MYWGSAMENGCTRHLKSKHGIVPKVANHKDAIEEVTKKLLRDLKDSYHDSSHPIRRQIYLTVLGRGIENGLNTGNYDLSDPGEAIIDTMMAMIDNYLQSDQNLPLDSGFTIRHHIFYFCILQKINLSFILEPKSSPLLICKIWLIEAKPFLTNTKLG